jgi:glycosyltransferase involved in cell wall biosynthesis
LRDHGRAVLTSDGQIANVSDRSRRLQPVLARRGDVFLGLDLAAHLLPQMEGDLARWRRDGVAINIMVYDLLPLLRPEWFPTRTARNFDRWLSVLARQADRCICISGAVAEALSHELAHRTTGSLPEVTSIPLGSDLAASYPSRGLPAEVSRLREWLQSHRVLLSVGTIEPRKGHQQLLAALSRLWQADPAGDIALLIVGRPGWNTKDLQLQLGLHPEQGKRMIWLEGASDELLAELYAGVAGLVAASHGEGFGLPLIEALAHGAPVLARDLPVFREIGGALFDYFDNDAPEPFGRRLLAWLAAPRRPTAAAMAALPRWADSGAALAACIGLPVAQHAGSVAA